MLQRQGHRNNNTPCVRPPRLYGHERNRKSIEVHVPVQCSAAKQVRSDQVLPGLALGPQGLANPAQRDIALTRA